MTTYHSLTFPINLYPSHLISLLLVPIHRNASDLHSVNVPQKYRKLQNFHEYVSGIKYAPVLTIFIGGNHEASNVLQSLYYGGWVAPNIYFLGYAGVVQFGGLRIGGLSGIYNQGHYRVGNQYVDLIVVG